MRIASCIPYPEHILHHLQDNVILGPKEIRLVVEDLQMNQGSTYIVMKIKGHTLGEREEIHPPVAVSSLSVWGGAP